MHRTGESVRSCRCRIACSGFRLPKSRARKIEFHEVIQCRSSPQIPCPKIPLYENQKTCICCGIPRPHEGRFAIVTDVGRGMRWTQESWAQSLRKTTGALADGEIVWSWPPDAEAKLAARSAGDGGKKARSPGRSRISRKAIAQGRPDVRPNLWFSPPAFLLLAGHGCGLHPAFPAPSEFRGPQMTHNSGAKRAAGPWSRVRPARARIRFGLSACRRRGS
jgi:hypothetical protein